MTAALTLLGVELAGSRSSTPPTRFGEPLGQLETPHSGRLTR
jgi:hypothetical protein